MRRSILLVSFFIVGSLAATAQESQSMDQQMRSMFKSDAFQLGVLIQSRGVFSLDEDGFNGGRKFDMGATRIDIRGRLDGNFTYRLQVDVRQQTSLIDAQVGYRFNSNTRLVAGAFKPFTSLDLDPGPQSTDFLNRARQVGAMMNVREIGLTLLGDHGAFSYRIGMYNGTGLTRQNDDRFMYSARLAYALKFQEDASLKLGFSGFINQTHDVSVGNSGLTTSSDRIAYGVFADYDSSFLFGAFEVLQTSFDAVQLTNQTETILGYYITLGAKINDKNQVLARWDQLEYDIMDRSSGLVVLGWSHFPTRVIKISVNALALLNNNGDNAAGVSAQFQYSF